MKTRLFALSAVLALLAVLSCLSLPAVSAQGVTVNPTLATFDLPSDYDSTSNFMLEIYRQADNVLVRETNIGKGTVNGAKVTTPLVRGSGLNNNVVHVFRIVQVNAIGSKRSVTTSNPFVMGDLPVGVSGLRAE